MSRPVWDLELADSELPEPWPRLAELAARLPHRSWTLIGGLMVQAHVLHAGLGIARPTDDIDLLLHIETGAIGWRTAMGHLRSLGYDLRAPAKGDPAHRFVRPGPSMVSGEQIVDVLIADHPAPRAIRNQVGHSSVVGVPGGTSALRKTVDLRLRFRSGDVVLISLPNVLGALTLKGGAFLTASPDRERHLFDAAMLVATVEDADALAESAQLWTGSDAQRIRVLARSLPREHPAWGHVPQRLRRRAQATLDVLAEGPRSL